MLGEERLQHRQLLAVTAAAPLSDLAIAPGAEPLPIPLAAAFQDSAVTGTVVRFATNAVRGRACRCPFVSARGSSLEAG